MQGGKGVFQGLEMLERSAERGDAVHEVEEMAWGGLIEMGREMIVAYIEKQEEEVPRPEVIEHEGKQLQRLPGGACGRMFPPSARRRSPRRLRHAGNATSGGGAVGRETRHAGERYVVSLAEVERHAVRERSYPESRTTLQRSWALPRRSTVWRTWRGADTPVYFDEQTPVEPTTEAEILVATSDCKGVPMRQADAPWTNSSDDGPQPKRKRLKKGEKNGQKRMACVGGVYSVAPFRRTVEDVLNEILRKDKQPQRPQPQNKRLRAVLTREVDGTEVNAKEVVFDWLAKEVRQRDPQERRTVVAIMDGETKLRDLQELKIGRAIGILDIWHVTEYLWKLAYCFHAEGSDAAEAFVETYLRKLLEGKVARVIGGIRQMMTKRGLSKPKCEKAQQCLNYFAQRCDTMKYDEYLAAGYPIGSGVVEGACRHLVKDRMEQTGMRWRIAGAQAVLSLRAIYVNNDWDMFHADRIQAEQRRLYPYKKRLHAILNCVT